MPKAKAAPNFNPMLEETGDALSDEEKAAAAAEERGEPAVQAVPDEAEQSEAPEVEAAEDGKGGKKPKVIPYDRFQEVVTEKNQSKGEIDRLNRELAAQNEKWARLEERQKLANEAQTRAEQAAKAAERAAQRPDPDVDPAGARAWDNEQALTATRAELAQVRQFVEGRSQQLEGWTQNQQLAGYAQQAANMGRTRHPDWDARVDFARAERVKAWMKVGHNEESARNIVNNEEIALLRSAAQSGADIVAAVADMTNQWGYKPTNGNARVNGGANLKLDQIAAGQRVQGQGRVQSAQAPVQKEWKMMDDRELAEYIGNTLTEDQYMEMLKTEGKEFAQRVNELDLRM
jgi:hypothetical protein